MSTRAAFGFLAVATAAACVGGTTNAQDVIWARQFGTPLFDRATAVCADDSGVYVVGHTYGAVTGREAGVGTDDVFVRKYDLDGNELWTRQFGTNGQDIPSAVCSDATGVYVVGRVKGALPEQTYAGDTDVFIRKYDPDGVELWTRQFGADDWDNALGCCAYGEGILITGTVGASLVGGPLPIFSRAFVRQYGADGEELWTHEFDPRVGASGVAVCTQASSAYVAGYVTNAFPGQSESAPGWPDVFVAKFAADGPGFPPRQFGPVHREMHCAICADATGLYVAGSTERTLAGETKVGMGAAWVRKYDPQGTVLWTRQFGPGGFSRAQARGVAADATGVYVAGSTSDALPGQTEVGVVDAYVRKYDADGNELWTKQFGSIGTDDVFSLFAHNGGLYVAGDTHPAAFAGQTNAGGADAFVVKLSAGGEP